MVEILPLDDVWVRINCDDAIAHELSDYFTFETPGSAFMRRQARFRKWDGRIRLFKLKTRTLYRGLVTRLIEFCDQRGYAYQNDVLEPDNFWEDPTTLQQMVETLHLPHALRDYQYTAVDQLLKKERAIILSPTASGKSLIIYTLVQILGLKTLIVVPTIGLVSQMAKDFKSYGFDLKNLHTIQAGREKDADADLYISTWQSIYQLPPEYFAQFQCIIVDEVHGAKSKSLTHLMEQATMTPYRFGFTGTLDDTQAHQLILEGLFGTVIRVATTQELVKAHHLSPLRVKMVMLHYPESVCKQLRHVSYQDELDYLVQDTGRLEFTARLADSLTGNVLLLFNFVGKHGIPLFERIQALTQKPVHYIAGSVAGDEREEIRELVELDKGNHIIVASYGTFSTGMNVPSLRHLIFGSPSKSKIRVLQSIGRGLRLDTGKDHCTLWDLVDDLRIGKHVNYTMRHAELRAEYYAAEKFPLSVKTISMDAFSHQTDAPNVLVDAPSNAAIQT